MQSGSTVACEATIFLSADGRLAEAGEAVDRAVREGPFDGHGLKFAIAGSVIAAEMTGSARLKLQMRQEQPFNRAAGTAASGRKAEWRLRSEALGKRTLTERPRPA